MGSRAPAIVVFRILARVLKVVDSIPGSSNHGASVPCIVSSKNWRSVTIGKDLFVTRHIEALEIGADLLGQTLEALWEDKAHGRACRGHYRAYASPGRQRATVFQCSGNAELARAYGSL